MNSASQPTKPVANHAKPDGSLSRPRRPRWKRRELAWLAVGVALWFLGDFAYSRFVEYQIRRWESSIPWSADGLAPDASEVSMGNGEVGLLMLHGFNDSPQVFRKLAPALSQRGYACRAILLPGFGRTVDAYANATVESWLDKLEQEIESMSHEHQQVVLVAHSLGGALAINHTLSGQHPADSLVLLAPAIEVSNARSPILPTRFWHEFGKVALPSTTITYSPFEMDAHDPLERDRAGRNRFSPRKIVDNTFQLIDANRRRATELTLPTLLFVTDSDRVIDPQSIRTFYEQTGSKRKRLVTLEDSGHMIPVDRQWQTVVEEIDNFVRKPNKRQ